MREARLLAYNEALGHANLVSYDENVKASEKQQQHWTQIQQTASNAKAGSIEETEKLRERTRRT